MLEIPEWLEKGTIRCDSDSDGFETAPHATIPQSEQWSCASSDAEEVEWEENEISDDKPIHGLDPNSDTPPDLDTSDLQRDLEEACGLRMALDMRYVPDGTHCIATWNANNGFDTKAIATLMLRGSISILFIQEPKVKVTDVDIGFITKGLMQYGLRGYCTRYQFMIYNEAVLGARIDNVNSKLEGRLITCDLKINAAHDNKYINITGCYDVPQGNKIYADGSTRDQHRKQLFHAIKKTMRDQSALIKTKKASRV